MSGKTSKDNEDSLPSFAVNTTNEPEPSPASRNNHNLPNVSLRLSTTFSEEPIEFVTPVRTHSPMQLPNRAHTSPESTSSSKRSGHGKRKVTFGSDLPPDLEEQAQINEGSLHNVHYPEIHADNDSMVGNLMSMGSLTMGGLIPGATYDSAETKIDDEEALHSLAEKDSKTAFFTKVSDSSSTINRNEIEDDTLKPTTPIPFHGSSHKFSISKKSINNDNSSANIDMHSLNSRFSDRLKRVGTLRGILRKNDKLNAKLKNSEEKGLESSIKKNLRTSTMALLSKAGDAHPNPILKTRATTISGRNPEQVVQEQAQMLVQSQLPKKKSRKPMDTDHLTSDSSSSLNVPNPDLYLRDDCQVYEDRDALIDGNLVDGDSKNSDEYIPPPSHVKAGVLSSLLQLYQNPNATQSSGTLLSSYTSDTAYSGDVTPDHDDFSPNASSIDLTEVDEKLEKKNEDSEKTSKRSKLGLSMHRKKTSMNNINSESTIAGLIFSTTNVVSAPGDRNSKSEMPFKPALTKSQKKRKEREAKITVHIAHVLQRQRFILRMCRALMLYGAPTHRLEEYMKMTARVLEIDGQFLYMPGCMIVSFGDASTRTSEMHLVRCDQGVNLSKLHDVHRIYKEVVHDKKGVEEAAAEIDEILSRRPRYPPWACVFLSGLASAIIGPMAFKAGWMDMPICFGLGLIIAWLRLIIAPKSSLYANVFEVSATILVSFVGRAIGSIGENQDMFCFSGIVQGSIATILPGFMILCGSLELQSRNIVAGSVRMFYAIIYSLFLGFGITLGAMLYGWIDHNATSETSCSKQVNPWFKFLFLPCYTIVISLINQARLSQLPVMVAISSAGYAVNYFSGKHFTSNSEFTSALGCFCIGILGNAYSRIGNGLAVVAMMPGIMVQVPGGVASQGTLLSGIQTADDIVSGNSTTTTTSSVSSSSASFGVTMVEVSIGISVGLFSAAMCIYPFGKKRTGLFTF